MSTVSTLPKAADIRDALCDAFCSALDVQRLPHGGGFSVGSSAFQVWGENARAYLIQKDDGYCLRDTGLLLPDLAASGVDFSSATRRQALDTLLEDMFARRDESGYEIETERMPLDVAIARLPKFLIGLARIADLALQSTERTASTFKEDVAKLLEENKPKEVRMTQSAPLAAFLKDIPADIVLNKPGRVPYGLWLASSEKPLFWAMLAMAEARRHSNGTPRPRIVALLEHPKVGADKTRTMAANRLDAVRVYEGDQEEAINAIIGSLDDLPSDSSMVAH